MKRLFLTLLLLFLAGCRLTPFGGTPDVTEITPADGANNVALGAAVKLTLALPNGGVNVTSANDDTVKLTNEATGEQVPAIVRVEGTRLTLTPTAETGLEFDTTYRFDLTTGLEDELSNAFPATSVTFTTIPDDVPAVLRSDPVDGAFAVSSYDTAAITSDISGVGGGVDPETLTTDNVYVTNLATGERVSGAAQTSGGTDTINVPLNGLVDGNEYELTITDGVEAGDGTPFVPYSSTFIVGALDDGDDDEPAGNVAAVFQESSSNVRHSTLIFGPDGNLYAATIDGRILRYPVGNDGSLGAPETLTTIAEPDGSARLVVGLTFDPTATANDLIAWVSSSSLNDFAEGGEIQKGNATWTGKILRLSGPNLATQQEVVVGLPRSTKDHVTNSIAFNPAEPGVLYFNQGSNTAMGAPDASWNYRPESLLSGAVLRLDYAAVGSGTLNVQTEEGGSYDPYAPGAPLTIYATGIRNAYDLVWHSNGDLYVPGNGSAAGGNIPRYDPIPGTCENRPDAGSTGGYTGPMLANSSDLPNYIEVGSNGDPVDGWRVDQTMEDFLFNIKEGGYYGTPNPARCEWILFGGGAGTGNQEDVINIYPSTVDPDPNYRGYAHNFGQKISPNGVIEYQGDAFSQYKGMLLVARYSVGDNIVALEVDGSGAITGEQNVVPINTLADPIDLTQDPETGYIYVSAYDASGESDEPMGITLLRPQ